MTSVGDDSDVEHDEEAPTKDLANVAPDKVGLEILGQQIETKAACILIPVVGSF